MLKFCSTECYIGPNTLQPSRLFWMHLGTLKIWPMGYQIWLSFSWHVTFLCLYLHNFLAVGTWKVKGCTTQKCSFKFFSFYWLTILYRSRMTGGLNYMYWKAKKLKLTYPLQSKFVIDDINIFYYNYITWDVLHRFTTICNPQVIINPRSVV